MTKLCGHPVDPGYRGRPDDAMTTQDRFVQLAEELDTLEVEDDELIVKANGLELNAGHVRALAKWLACRPKPKLKK